LKSQEEYFISKDMKKLFLSTLLIAFAIAAQAGGEACAKADKAGDCTQKTACPAQQAKAGSCCGGVEQAKARSCSGASKCTETASKQKLQTPKDASLAKK